MQARLTELEGLREKLLRSAADFENAKKRLVREKEEFIKFGQESLIRSLLPVLDNFDRALAHADEAKEYQLKSLVSGIQMVYKQMLNLLCREGVRRVEAIDQKFDPHKHEAIGYVEAPGKEDKVVEEVEAGYFLHDRLIRAAKVRVGQSGSAPPTPSDEEEKEEEIT
ncbi:MAG: nucleotide exchange factor GrpE [Candidatus Omnitrophica bacterium]|nr:nucleotide exchange factor GrpE [Candidatus Omnitrophota bacterium]